MPPVRIKYYGLIPMTKRAYLIALTASGLMALFIVVTGGMLGALPPLDTMWSSEHHRRGTDVLALLHNYLYWIIVVCLAAQAFDIWITLRVFAKKEAAQRKVEANAG